MNYDTEWTRYEPSQTTQQKPWKPITPPTDFCNACQQIMRGQTGNFSATADLNRGQNQDGKKKKNQNPPLGCAYWQFIKTILSPLYKDFP